MALRWVKPASPVRSLARPKSVMCGWPTASSRMLAGFGFRAETPDILRGSELAAQDHLQGNDTIEADLAGLEDNTHAAPCDLLDDLVVPEVVDRRASRSCSIQPGGE